MEHVKNFMTGFAILAVGCGFIFGLIWFVTTFPVASRITAAVALIAFLCYWVGWIIRDTNRLTKDHDRYRRP